jgi:pSer/pThr/pTyr-binding forkhead associated (FHA) protein
VSEAGQNLTGLLEVAEGSLTGKRFALTSNQVMIGRGEICDICLPDNSISRRHAVLSRSGRQFTISDRSSTNGTYVNGVKVSQRELIDGDMIKMGNTVLIFKVE